MLIVYAAAAGLVVIAGLAFRWPRIAAPFAIGFALLATTGASVAATRYDQSNAASIKTVVLGDHPSFVDESGVGPTSLLLMPGGKIPDAKLFWNKSLDRLLLLPGMKPADPFTTYTVDVGNNGIVSTSGKVVTGPVMVDDTGTTVQLQQAKLVERTTSGALYRADSGLRLGLLAFGRYADGWLGDRGQIIVWPMVGEHTVAGRLELALRTPGPNSNATIELVQTTSGKDYRYTLKPGKSLKISIPLCASGPVTLAFHAAPLGSLGDGRGVAARSTEPHFVRDAAAVRHDAARGEALEPRVLRRRHLEPEAVGVEEERRVVVRVVLRPELRCVEDLRAGLDRGRVNARRPPAGVSDDEGQMVEPGCVELERLRLERLAQADRAGARPREAQVVDLLAALAVEERRLGEAERAEHRAIERERAREVAADEIDVTEADEHQRRMFTARATTIRPSVRLTADSTSISTLAHRLSGIVSVGLNAAEFVYETKR